MIAVVRNLQPGDSKNPLTLSKVIAELRKRAADAQLPGATLLIDREVVLDADIDVPATIDLRFIGAGRIVRGESSATLRLARTPRAGLWQVFGRPNEPETIPVVRFSTRCDPVYTDWWGGSGNNWTDWDNGALRKNPTIDYWATAKGFQAALDSVAPRGGVVRIAPGTYTLTQTLQVHSGTTLAGVDGNRVKLRWIRCDGIRIDRGAVDVEVSGFSMHWTPGPAGAAGGCTAIAMSSGRGVRIEGVTLQFDAGSANQFETGIHQQATAGGDTLDRMRDLRILHCLPMARGRLVVLEAADDVRLEDVLHSRNIANGDRPAAIGLVVGCRTADPCRDVRVLDGSFERLAVCVLVVNADGLRIEGNYFEVMYRNHHTTVFSKNNIQDYFDPPERRYIVVQAVPGDPDARALSGEGMEVGFNYFYDTYRTPELDRRLVPSAHVEWANPFDRRLTKVFNLGGICRLAPGKDLPPGDKGNGIFLNPRDILYSDNPVGGPLGWICRSRHDNRISLGDAKVCLAWAPLEPDGVPGPLSWRRFGRLEPLETGEKP